MNTLESPHRIARITGLLYLMIMILAGFGEGFVRSGLIVAGDPATTAANIASSETLFRVGFIADLTAFMLDLVVAILLYLLLKPVSRTLALITTALRLIAHPAIASLNLLNHYNALHLLHAGQTGTGFSIEQIQSLVMLSLDSHATGYLIAGAIFGLHLILLGILVAKSQFLPRLIGILLVIAGAGYLIESYGNFLLPGNEELLTWFVAIPAVLGEGALTFWLLLKGVNRKYWDEMNISSQHS